MSLTQPPALQSDLLDLARTCPAPAAAEAAEGGVCQQILAHLAVAELLTLHTIGKHRWPVAHCMHFANYWAPDQRPVIYMFTHEETRKLANIVADPRVGMTLFRGHPADPTQGAPYLRMGGVAQRIDGDEERELAMEGQFNKVNYGFARYLGLETQPALRVDVAWAEWSPSGLDGPRQAVRYRLDG